MDLWFSKLSVLLATFGCLIVGFGLLASEQATPGWRPSPIQPDAPPKLILTYTGWYGHEVVFPGFGFEHCKVTNCILTDDKADFNRSDAVWFHSAWTLDKLPPYPRPSPTQIWINSEVEALVEAFGEVPQPLANGPCF